MSGFWSFLVFFVAKKINPWQPSDQICLKMANFWNRSFLGHVWFVAAPSKAFLTKTKIYLKIGPNLRSILDEAKIGQHQTWRTKTRPLRAFAHKSFPILGGIQVCESYNLHFNDSLFQPLERLGYQTSIKAREGVWCPPTERVTNNLSKLGALPDPPQKRSGAPRPL